MPIMCLTQKAITIIIVASISLVTVDSRSFLRTIGDVMQETTNIGDTQPQPSRNVDLAGGLDDTPFNSIVSRSRRSVDNLDDCPVHPDTPVIIDDKETYLDFDANEPAPESFPNENLSCPSPTGDWWGTRSEEHLKASCPWVWRHKDMREVYTDKEVYPRYVKEADCLCTNCVNANVMGCKYNERNFTFYAKVGCDGNKPMMTTHQLAVKLGCYCSLG